MISIITPTYNTSADVLMRTWNSIKAQTHKDWQWVVYDDSPTENMEVFRQMLGICSDERYNVQIYKPHNASGRGIGNAKKQAFGFANGDILVELDHPQILGRVGAGLRHPLFG